MNSKKIYCNINVYGRLSFLLALITFGYIGLLTNQLKISFSFAILYFGVSLTPWAIRQKCKNKFDPFEPYFGLTILFFLYSFATVSYFEFNGGLPESEDLSLNQIYKYIVVCLMGQIGLFIGYYFLSKDSIKPNKISFRYDKSIKILIGPALILAIAVSPFIISKFNFLNITSYAEAAFASRVNRMNNPNQSIIDVIFFDPSALIILCAATYVYFQNSKKYFIKSIAVLLFLCYLSTSFLSGMRGQFAVAALIPIVYYHYSVRRFNAYTLVLGSIALYFFMNALSIMRSFGDLFSMIEILTSHILDDGLSFLALSSSSELLTSANLGRLIRGIDEDEASFQYGNLFISQIGSFIPRALWPNRPFLASEVFVQTFYPGLYESGGGYGFFYHQDGYWDFGYLGVLFYAVILGFIVRKIYDILILADKTQFNILLYTVLYGALVLSTVRSGLVASIKGAIMTALPLLIIYFYRYLRKSNL